MIPVAMLGALASGQWLPAIGIAAVSIIVVWVRRLGKAAVVRG